MFPVKKKQVGTPVTSVILKETKYTISLETKKSLDIICDIHLCKKFNL